MNKEEKLQMEMRKMISDRQFAIEYALQFIGTYYSWGGDDPIGGFDCSGFVSELAQAVGFIKRKERLTAEGFRERFSGEYTIKSPVTGALVLFLNKDNGKATHIELCIDGLRSIGASGGGSTTLTKEKAIEQNAFIKIRPINYDDGRDVIFVDPIMSMYQELHQYINGNLIIPEKNIIIPGGTM